MTATELEIGRVPAPQDEPPELEGESYSPEFPGSTPEAPYGFKANGEPYRRRPKGSGKGASTGSKGPGRMPASETAAKSAAGLLARLNSLIGLALATSHLPMTAAELARNNETFETMAYEALLADPALCRKILGAGATSGKAGLVMAYSMLTISIVPAARMEIQERRALREAESNEA